jgi:hypothetical protein
MNQEVIPSLTRLGEDGVKTIVMRDTRTNQIRELDVDAPLFDWSRQGKLAITDAKTQAL